MSHEYKTVNWNPRKIFYDLCVWLGIVAYIGAFIAVTGALHRGETAISAPIVLMRAFSTCAFLLLTLTLCIGPLARLHPRFLPLLYNRRHLGVSLFIIALLHAALAIYWYHSFGVINPIASVFVSGGDYQSLSDIPFQTLGAAALVILFIMAATSHDYWNATLGPGIWKTLHILVYLAYALIVLHIVFGALQNDQTGLLVWMAAGSVLLVGGLHILAGLTKSGADVRLRAQSTPKSGKQNWIAVANWREIPNQRAITIDINANERVAVFRYEQTKLAAVSNVCRHQGGPLGEGCVVDGLLTCPWHGYQYRLEDGCSPPPFNEKISTYRLALDGERVLLDTAPLPPGTPRAVLEIPNNLNNSD